MDMDIHQFDTVYWRSMVYLFVVPTQRTLRNRPSVGNVRFDSFPDTYGRKHRPFLLTRTSVARSAYGFQGLEPLQANAIQSYPSLFSGKVSHFPLLYRVRCLQLILLMDFDCLLSSSTV